MAEATAQVGRAAHLPEQPIQRLGPAGDVLRQEFAELLRQVQQDRAGFEDPDRLRPAAVEQGRNLGIRVDPDEAGAELVAIGDPDQPGVVFGAAMAERQQLLEQDGDLHAVRRAERIELQRVAADRQFLVVGRSGDGAVDAGEGAAAGLLPRPDLGWRVVLGFRHCRLLRHSGRGQAAGG